MHFTSTLQFLSALLAGQIAASAHIPHHGRAQIVRTEVRTIYSTKVVYATPAAAVSINPKDGLPLAPSISKLSIPLSSLQALNPANGPAGPSVRKPTTRKPAPTPKPAPKPAGNSLNLMNGLPTPVANKPTPAPAPTPKPGPAASSAAAGIAAIIRQQQAKASSVKAAAAHIASLLAHLPKTPRPSPTKPGIVIVPVTLKTTTKPKPAATTEPALLTDSRPTPAPNVPGAKAKSLLAVLSAAQN